MNNSQETVNPYEAGLPIAFAYSQTDHPDSFQVRINRGGPSSICTMDISALKRHVGDMRSKVVFLTKDQIVRMDDLGGAFNCRPFTPEEQEEFLAD